MPSLLACLLAGTLAASASAELRVRSGTTSVQLDADVLGDLGIEAVFVGGTPDGPARTFPVAPGADLHFAAEGRDFEGFAGGSLPHSGGFVLRGPGPDIDLSGFVLRPGTPPHLLELAAASGQRWFELGSAQGEIDADSRRLELRNADLLLSAELAAWLGRPELRGSYAGFANLALDLEPAPGAPSAAFAGPAAAGADPCEPDFSGDVDVELIELASLTQAAREAGGRVSMAPSATLRNSGVATVPWNRAIAPDSPVGQHPYLALHFYRLDDGVLEQLGRADLKHAFYATNSNCACPGGNNLLPGCEDEYGVSTNLNTYHLAPREELTASTGSWAGLGSHFDATPVDAVRDHSGYASHDSFEHRLIVQEPDLQTPRADYYVEAWYLAAGDVNLFNSVGHRRVDPSFGGSTWAFPFVDAGLSQGSVLDELVDPKSPPFGSANELLDTGEGTLQLVAVASNPAAGTWHYEYALMNFDFDRKLASFEVPFAPGIVVSNAGFGDGDADGANDWTPTIEADAIVWTAPAGHELDWGTLINFRFDSDTGPVASDAAIVAYEPGAGMQFPLPTRGPGAAPVGLGSWPWLSLLVAVLAVATWLLRRRLAAQA